MNWAVGCNLPSIFGVDIQQDNLFFVFYYLLTTGLIVLVVNYVQGHESTMTCFEMLMFRNIQMVTQGVDILRL